MPKSSAPAPGVRQTRAEPLALMETFEANYHCLLTLCPALRHTQHQERRHRADAPPGMPGLEIEVHEDTRYTITFTLACPSPGKTTKRHLPRVQVRLYRDSRQAELLGYGGRLQFFGPSARGAQCDEWSQRRAQGNHSLYRWLRYCLQRGYYFPDETGRAS